MCKELPVIPVNKVVDPKKEKSEKMAEEEERHKGSLTQKKLSSHSLGVAHQAETKIVN
jgi:hypothetical protein